MVFDLSMFQALFRLFRRKAKAEVQGETGIVPLANASELPHPIARRARFSIGDVLQHRVHPFRGIVFDIDPEFANTEEWYESIPEDGRPHRAQPYYHLLAENEDSHYVAYVSEQNLVPDESDEPLSHPDLLNMFEQSATGYALKDYWAN